MKKVEQIVHEKVILNEDVAISNNDKYKCLKKSLGRVEKEGNHYIFENNVILVKQITYLGHPHPIHKKRIQIPKYWTETYKKYHSKKNVVFLGIYKHKETTLYVDFGASTYAKNKANNSSAHIYTIDLLKGIEYGIFKKRDKNNNEINVIRPELFKYYLRGIRPKNSLSDIELINKSIDKINKKFKFNEPISALTAQKTMFDADWKDKNQCEWPGFYLEFFYNNCIKKLDLGDKINFISQKKKGTFDYDLYFPQNEFYGDLKTSNITKKESPGNDLQDFNKYFETYEKFWYLIYEHETIKSTKDDHKTLKLYNKFKLDNKQWPIGKKFDELSYSSRFKANVTFKKMMIIEINTYNKHLVINNVFKQGKQTNGSKRNEKFLINKNDLENFVIYRYFGGK